MNKKINLEYVLGLLILIISIISIFYYSSKLNLFKKMDTLQINSSFFDIGNINLGNDVKIKKNEYIVRLHIGLEDAKDLINDIKQSLRFLK